jgi:tRNA(fMet)-specific endonuclease VapC
MSFLLDTDICSAQLKGDRAVFSKFMQYAGWLHISAVMLGEL